MTVGEALPRVCERLGEKALTVSTLRDELAEAEALFRQYRDEGKKAHATRQSNRAKKLRRRIAANTTRAVINLREDLEAAGRGDLIGPLVEFAKRCLARQDAYKQVNRLFLAKDREDTET